MARGARLETQAAAQVLTRYIPSSQPAGKGWPSGDADGAVHSTMGIENCHAA